MEPVIAPELLDLFDLYTEIRARAAPQLSRGRLTWADLDAWERRHERRLESWELAAISVIETADLEVAAGIGERVIDDGNQRQQSPNHNHGG